MKAGRQPQEGPTFYSTDLGRVLSQIQVASPTGGFLPGSLDGARGGGKCWFQLLFCGRNMLELGEISRVPEDPQWAGTPSVLKMPIQGPSTSRPQISLPQDGVPSLAECR